MAINWSNLFPVDRSARGNYGLSTYIADQTNPIIDLPFLKLISSSATLDADTVFGEYSFEATTGHSISAGNIVELANGTQVFYQGRVLAAGVNTISLDAPINHVFEAGSTIFESTDEMQVIGSTASPQIFSITPVEKQRGDIVRVILTITSTSPQDFEKFGADTALTQGLTLRSKRLDEYFNFFNFKNNGDFQRRSFDSIYQTNTGGGVRSFTSRRTFGGQDKNGAVVRLEAEFGEQLQVVIADDLVTGSANTSIKMYAQGHVLDEGTNA